MTTLLWLRQDLRLSDNLALCWAVEQGPVVPVYILEEDTNNPWPDGKASRWWLHNSLASLATQLAKKGAPLILRKGDPQKVLRELIRKTKATAVTWNHVFTPHALKRDAAIEQALQQEGVTVTTHNASLLFLPVEISTKEGHPYRVFTPFARQCKSRHIPMPLAAPKKIASVPNLSSDNLETWDLKPSNTDSTSGFSKIWSVSEEAAQKKLHNFLEEKVATYDKGHDIPGIENTSRLSPYLHLGQISARQVWHAALHHRDAEPEKSDAIDRYLNEILWREFAYHILFHFPDTPHAPMQKQFASFPWRKNASDLAAWQKGLTGYPLVDAGMRQLLQTGWMHNRVRMVVASFLVKHLLLPWQEGAAWFWDHLVDADLANNTASWQWIAGCGADAAPYYRIFNPTLQSQRFDPDGVYIRTFVPELAKLSKKDIHAPWTVTESVLADAGVILGKTYPKPMIEHDFARKRALSSRSAIKKT